MLRVIHKGRPADPGEGGSAESALSIVILIRFYCFIGTQGEGWSRNPGFSRTSFVNGPLLISRCFVFNFDKVLIL